MSQLGEILTKNNVSTEQVKEIVAALKINPLSAMEKLSQLNLGAETIQQMLGVVMMNPSSITELAEEMGISSEEIDLVKQNLSADSGL